MCGASDLITHGLNYLTARGLPLAACEFDFAIGQQI